MNRPRKLIGKQCYLSPLSYNDIELFTTWVNELNSSVFITTYPSIITLEQEKMYIDRLSSSESGNYVLSIIDLATDKTIGNCGLHKVDSCNRSAELGIFIGDADFLEKGYGSEAVNLILDYGFNALNLHSIWLRTFSFNRRALKTFEKCGFKPAGRKRQAKIIGNRKYDEVIMDILGHEYKSMYIEPEFSKIIGD